MFGVGSHGAIIAGMRFHLGPPPATPNFAPQEQGWTPLREPSPLVLNFLAVPIGLVMAIAIGAAWGMEKLSSLPGLQAFGMYGPLLEPLIVLFVGLPLLILGHEWIHTWPYPRGGWTDQTLIAAWPSKMLFYALHLGPLGRNRWLVVYLLPLFVISILPLLVCRLLGINPFAVAAVSTINALLSGGDIIGFGLIARQVPAGAMVQNQGWNTWWKMEEC